MNLFKKIVSPSPLGITLFVGCILFNSFSLAGQTPPFAGLWQFDGDFTGEEESLHVQLHGAPPHSFGTCDDFGVARIDGSNEQILKLSKNPNADTSWFDIPTGVPANGGGTRINEHTVVMDLLFTTPAGEDGWTVVLNFDETNSGEFASVWYLLPNGQFDDGWDTGSQNNAPTDTWNRIAIRSKVIGGSQIVDFFINGEFAFTSAWGRSIDGRGSAAPSPGSIAFWADPGGDKFSGTGYVNSIAFINQPLTDEEVFSLGEPSAGGIPVSVDVVLQPTPTITPTRIPVPTPMPFELVPGFDPNPIPGVVGAPIYATHSYSQAIIPDGSTVYFAYFGGGSYVVRLDTENGVWSEPVLLGGLSTDAHWYPDMIMDHDGYLHAMYGSHGNPFEYRRTVRPRDISEWTTPKKVGVSTTYPRLFLLNDGRIVNVYRDAPTWGYSISSDGGDTWVYRPVKNSMLPFGGMKIAEFEGQPPTIYWGWSWWDSPICDNNITLGTELPTVNCKYDNVEYAAFPLGENVYLDGEGNAFPLLLQQGSTQPVWERDWSFVNDASVNDQGHPVIAFNDYFEREISTLHLATYHDGWVIEEPVPGIEFGLDNVRIRDVGTWTVIVATAIGEDHAGIYVIQRQGIKGPFWVRRLTDQSFPYQMHPMFEGDVESNRLHIFWTQGDAKTSSKVIYGSIPLSPPSDTSINLHLY